MQSPAEEIFAESFAATINKGRGKQKLLLEPGDVVVLNASPWRASDDTVFGLSSLQGEDEELGMQLVVETSLFNPNAEVPPWKGRENNHNDMPLATCHERDLQPLVSKAQAIHKKLGQPNFIDLMVERMKKDEALGEKQNSPFFYTFEERNLARQSQIVTSWTIKTDIGVGSSRFDLNALTMTELAGGLLFALAMSILICYFCWSLRLWSQRKRSSDQGERRKHKYSRVSSSEVAGRYQERDDDTVGAVINDDTSVVSRGMTEMATISSMMGMATISEQSEGTSSVASSTMSIGSLSTYFAKTASFGQKQPLDPQ